MSSNTSGEYQPLRDPLLLRASTAKVAREMILYMMERGRAASRGEASPPLPAVLPTVPASGSSWSPRAPVFQMPPCGALGNRHLAARYRAWWHANLPTPYGLCACGCGGRTPRAGWTSRQRGFVSGEPLAFLPHHRKRYGYPTLTEPGRRCACGCGRQTPVVRDTAMDEEGVPYQFAGMRAEYLNTDHRPPPGLPGLTLTTPLGAPGEAGLSEEERVWLAEVVDAHLSFSRDRSRMRPKLQSTDGELVRGFLEVSGCGRVDVSQPCREGASPMWKWTGRSSLEAANVLHNLYELLLPKTRESAQGFFEEMEFPVPYLSSSGG